MRNPLKISCVLCIFLASACAAEYSSNTSSEGTSNSQKDADAKKEIYTELFGATEPNSTDQEEQNNNNATVLDHFPKIKDCKEKDGLKQGCYWKWEQSEEIQFACNGSAPVDSPETTCSVEATGCFLKSSEDESIEVDCASVRYGENTTKQNFSTTGRDPSVSIAQDFSQSGRGPSTSIACCAKAKTVPTRSPQPAPSKKR